MNDNHDNYNIMTKTTTTTNDDDSIIRVHFSKAIASQRQEGQEVRSAHSSWSSLQDVLDEEDEWKAFAEAYDEIVVHNYNKVNIVQLMSLLGPLSGICIAMYGVMERLGVQHQHHYHFADEESSDSGSLVLGPVVFLVSTLTSFLTVWFLRYQIICQLRELCAQTNASSYSLRRNNLFLQLDNESQASMLMFGTTMRNYCIRVTTTLQDDDDHHDDMEAACSTSHDARLSTPLIAIDTAVLL